MFAQVADYRERLHKNGVKYLFTYISDIQSNVSGGVRRGTIYDGRLEGMLDIDLEKFIGWQGGKVHFNGFAIHGHGLSRYDLDNILITSEIEALSTVRLSEFWYEHVFGDRAASIKVGQLAADLEFHTRNFGGPFVNGTFGWPEVATVNLPSGGPAYPFASPGVRVLIRPTANREDVIFRAAVFDGDPAGPGPNDPQERNRFGTNFRLRDPPLIIGEGEFKYGSTKEGWLLPGIIKLGVWNHLGKFNDLRLSVEGLSTADPSSSGIPLRRRGEDGIYTVIEQMINLNTPSPYPRLRAGHPLPSPGTQGEQGEKEGARMLYRFTSQVVVPSLLSLSAMPMAASSSRMRSDSFVIASEAKQSTQKLE